MININDIKNGMTVIVDGKICQIIEFLHVKPGKGPAFVRIKLKNLRTGTTVEQTFNTNIKLEKAMIEKTSMQFLYENAGNYNFMVGANIADIKGTAQLKLAEYTEKTNNALAPKVKLNLLKKNN